MGQSIYTIASPEDHGRLKKHLNPNYTDTDWRRYFRLSLAKAGPRSETPTYEAFSVMGMIRPPPDNNKKIREVNTSKISNEVIKILKLLYHCYIKFCITSF